MKHMTNPGMALHTAEKIFIENINDHTILFFIFKLTVLIDTYTRRIHSSMLHGKESIINRRCGTESIGVIVVHGK